MTAVALLAKPAVSVKTPDKTLTPVEVAETMEFDQALEVLKLKEEELRRLISEGEIGAKRDPNTGDPLPFKADVEAFRDWAELELTTTLPIEIPQTRTKAA